MSNSGGAWNILSFIDFRDDAEYEAQLDRLAREIKDLAPQGINNSQSSEDDRLSSNSGTEKAIADLFVSAFDVLTYAPRGFLRKTLSAIAKPLKEVEKPACELVLMNKTSNVIWIQEGAIISHYTYWDGMLYDSDPYTYRLNLRCTPLLGDTDESAVSGYIQSDKEFGRQVVGARSGWASMHYVTTELWFPLYCEVQNHDHKVIRFVIDNVEEGRSALRGRGFLGRADPQGRIEEALVQTKAKQLFEAVGPDNLVDFDAPENSLSHKGYREITSAWTAAVFRAEDAGSFGARLNGYLLV